jgi:hypothetical protein
MTDEEKGSPHVLNAEEARATDIVFTVVCTGPTVLSDGKLGLVLQVVEANGTLNPVRKVFGEKSCRKANISLGGIYKVEANADFSTAIIAGAKYQGLWPNEAERAGWKTAERALTIERAAQKRQKSDAENNAMIAALAPIRKAYVLTNSVGRLAIEVQVLAYLRGVRIIP